MNNEEDDEPIPAIADRLAGSRLPQKQHSNLFTIEVHGVEAESINETVPMASSKKLKINHLRQSKHMVIPIEVAQEEHMQLHEYGLELKFKKLKEQKKIQEDQEKREAEDKRELVIK
jgi:hypothetical protein